MKQAWPVRSRCSKHERGEKYGTGARDAGRGGVRANRCRPPPSVASADRRSDFVRPELRVARATRAADNGDTRVAQPVAADRGRSRGRARAAFSRWIYADSADARVRIAAGE